MQPIQSMVVPTDFSEPADAAFEHAVSLARDESAALHLVHAIRFPALGTPYATMLPSEIWKGVEVAARERLEGLGVRAERAGVAKVTTEVVDATHPVVAIEAAVVQRRGDLVVMGTHGYGGLKHAVLGSVAERTIRRSSCPVLAVSPRCPAPVAKLRRILVPVDFSKHSDEALRTALALAARRGAAIDLLHTVDIAPEYRPLLPPEAVDLESDMRRAAWQRLTEISASAEASGVAIDLHLESGEPAGVIAAAATRIPTDLIIMGTHGHTGWAHLMAGSVTERTLREATRPVLAVKACVDSETPAVEEVE